MFFIGLMGVAGVFVRGVGGVVCCFGVVTLFLGAQ
jgi:hypothetical protein